MDPSAQFPTPSTHSDAVERAIEFGLERPRLADFRRWTASDTPRALNPLEAVSASSYLHRQDLCLPLVRQELDANPNLSK